MALSALGTTDAVSASGSTLGLQDFMRILLTQLTYQDPLKPMDNEQFMAQMAQFSALEQTQQLNAKVQQLMDSQAALQSVALIGRTVDLQTPSGAATATVSALSLQGDAPLLSVTLANGTVLADVALSQVLAVH